MVSRFFSPLSAFISSVLFVTVLQSAPPAIADPSLFVDLITRTSDENGVAVMLDESSLQGASSGLEYRLDLDLRDGCGLLDHIDNSGVAGVRSPSGASVDWNAQSDYISLVGQAIQLELALDNIQIVRVNGMFGPDDCSVSAIKAYFMETTGNFPSVPQGHADYYLSNNDPFPYMYNFSQTSAPHSPRLNYFSDGFEIEWDEYLGATGYTPAGFTVRYRTFDGTVRGPWSYQSSSDGRLKSLIVNGLVDGTNYEAQIAPTVLTCDNQTIFGKFANIPMVSQFSVDTNQSHAPVGQEQTTGHDVVSQCGGSPSPSPSGGASNCVTSQSQVFDGSRLATVYVFTSPADPCDWEVPSTVLTSNFEFFLVGGGGGGGANSGGGGGGGDVGAYGIYTGSDVDATWTIDLGEGGAGASSEQGAAGSNGTSTSIAISSSTNLSVNGGTGGGSGGSSGLAQQGSNLGGDGSQGLFGGSGGDGDRNVSGENLLGNADPADGTSGGSGGAGSGSGTAAIDALFRNADLASDFGGGGGGGALCTDGNTSSGIVGGLAPGDAGDGGSCNSQSGSDAAWYGSGGGGGAGDGASSGGHGGDGGQGAIYLVVYGDAPLARYLPEDIYDALSPGDSCDLQNPSIQQGCATWRDSRNGGAPDAVITSNLETTTTATPPGNGSFRQEPIEVLQGTSSTGVLFNQSILPADYTLFTVARYNQRNGGQYNRIFDSLGSDNWFSGFWRDSLSNEPQSGLAFHGNSWLTETDNFANENHNFNWVISTDQEGLYRSNGVTRGAAASNLSGDLRLAINAGNFALEESSDFQVADVLTFDRELTEAEYSAVETFLGRTYGICVSGCVAPEITSTTLPDGQVDTPYSSSISVNSESPLEFSISGQGHLPRGLTLNPDTGVISGTPTGGGLFEFVIQVTNLDNHLVSTQNLSILIPSGISGCIDYRGQEFANNILLDANGYPIGCEFAENDPSTPQPESGTWAEVFQNEFGDSGPSNSGFDVRNGWACDDCSVGAVGLVGGEGPPDPNANITEGLPLGFTIDFYGVKYDSVFVNSNGSLSFGTPSTCYDTPLDRVITCNSETGGAVIAPYAIDLDNRDVKDANYTWNSDRHAEFFYWGKTNINGKQAFVATWMNSIGYNDESYNTPDFTMDRTGKWSTFQVVIEDTSSSSDPEDPTFGSADVSINYGSMQDSGNGYGTSPNDIGPEGQYPCGANSQRCIAIGLGTNFKDADGNWIPQLTSLTDQVTETQYNGLGADEVIDDGDFPLREGRYGSTTPGMYVFHFGNEISPPIATVSSAPIDVRATALDSAISLRWSAPLDLGGSTISRYSVEYRDNLTTSWTVLENVANSPYLIDSLTNGLNYEVRISANNGVGDSQYSTSSFAMPGADLVITSAQDEFELNDAFSNPGDLVSLLVDSGVAISNVTVDGESTFSSDFARKFGSFTNGVSSVGMSDGVVMSANDVNYFQRADNYVDPDGISYESGSSSYGASSESLNDLLWLSENWVPNNMISEGGEFRSICTNENGIGSSCSYNSTFIEFDVEPTKDFLKFEYSLAGTEEGNDASLYPDGFALFIGDQVQQNNCAVIPSGAMEAGSGGAISSATLGQRYLSMGNLRMAGLSKIVDSESSLRAEEISRVLSCVVDVSAYRQGSSPQDVHVTFAIADANDGLVSPAVFLKGRSIRFEDLSLPTAAIPAATIDQAYNEFSFETNGGAAPYAYELINDSVLPAGLTLSPEGILSGTPTSSGTFTFTLGVSDSMANRASQNFSMIVNGAPATYNDGRIVLNLDLVPGQSVTLTPSDRNKISGFDPREQLRLTMNIRNGSFALLDYSECTEVVIPAGFMNATGNTDYKIAALGTQAALNCFIGNISVTPYLGARLSAGVVSDTSTFDPIEKVLYRSQSIESQDQLSWSSSFDAANLDDSAVSGTTGYLASITSDLSALTLDALANTTQNLPDKLWIGLSDQERPNDWRWTGGLYGGMPAFFWRWVADEPVEDEARNFAYINTAGAYNVYLRLGSTTDVDESVGGYLVSWHLPEYSAENWASTQVEIPFNVLEDCDNPDTSDVVTLFSSSRRISGQEPITDTAPEAEDDNLRASICASYDVRIFDGGDFSVGDWSDALAGATALVLPESNVNYLANGFFALSEGGQPLFSPELVSELKRWNNPGHPIIFAGGYSHVDDLNILLDTSISFTTTDEGSEYFAQPGVSPDAPEVIAAPNATDSIDLEAFAGEDNMYLNDVNFKELYVTNDGPPFASVARFTNTDNENGFLYFLGFDWFDSPDSDAAGAWIEVLNRAISGTLVDEYIPNTGGNDPEDDRFLQGDFVEVGIGGNGHFGSSSQAPEGYHPGYEGNRLGFVSDRDRDGWGTGYDDGDFFVPGTPFEGFGIELGDSWYFNDHYTTDIQGSPGEVIAENNTVSSSWESGVMPNGLKVTQVANVPIRGQRLDVTVTLENTSDVDLSGLYYSRQVDPDNSVDDGCFFNTENSIVAQADTLDGVSLVSATTRDDCRSDYDPQRDPSSGSYLGIISTDSRSRVGMEHSGFFAKPASAFYLGGEFCSRDPEDEGACDTVSVEPGFNLNDDSGIGISFNIGTLEANDETSVTFSYILSPEQAQEIIDQQNNENNLVSPTLRTTRSNFVAVDERSFSLNGSDWLDASGGGPVSYYTVSPALPAGLSFDAETGGVTGTPTELMGPTQYVITAHNLAGTSSRNFLIAVVNGPYLTKNDGILTANWPSDSPASVPDFDYALSTDDGANWSDPVSVENTSSVLMSVMLMGDLGTTYKLRVRAVTNSGPQEWIESTPFFYGISGCTAESPQLNVLLLSSEAGDGGVGTQPSITDNNLLGAACSSQKISIDIFDGQGFGAGAVKGSADAWRNALENADVLILPKLVGGSLRGSDLMSEDAYDVLSDWVQHGGRLIATGAASYVEEIATLAGMEPGSIQVVATTNVEGSKREYSAGSSLPPHLLTYGQAGLNLWGISSPGYFLDHYGETSAPDSTSLASTYWSGNGTIVALSNDFADTDQGWTKVLTQAIHSTLSKSINVREGNSFWYLDRGEVYNGYYDTPASAIVRIGSALSPTTISCINTPSNPAIVSRSSDGTTVRCGSVMVNDGVVDSPINVRLTRFFAANSSWVKTSVQIENTDRTNTYENSVWFGGNLGVGDTPLLESEGQLVTSVEDMNPHSRVVVASAGERIRNGFDEGNGAMVVHVNGQEPTEIFGGIVLEGDPSFARNQLWTKTNFGIDSRESKTFSWFESYLEYQPGCDRYASLNAWFATSDFLANSEDEYSDDNFESNSRLRFPDLSDLSCTAYSGEAQDVEVRQVNGRVDIEWTRPIGAARYEIEYRVVGDDRWSSADEIDSDEAERDSYGRSDLEDGQTYEFRIRPIQVNRTMAGDVAKGVWTTTSPVTIFVEPAPSNSPSPSSSGTPSASPSVSGNVPGGGSGIVPAMIAQSGPSFPARLKKGKTVKFGMTVPSGLPLRVTSVGTCKTTPITKKVTIKVLVGKKFKKKKVKIQSGWALKGTKKGVCTVTFSNSGDATRTPLAVAGTITVF